jgi:hypothetical protein
MPIPASKRNYKHEYELQKKRGEDDERHERYKARKMVDEMGINRKGKHVAHKKALSRGGKTTKANIEVVAPRENLSYARRSDHKPKK